MRIDLHTHSSVSDGTETPAELHGDGPAAGLDVVALTDHDTTAGWAAAEAARPAGLTVVPGMELSCRWFPDDQPPISVHLLAYLFDPAHPGFAAERARLRDERLERGERIVAALAADGYPVRWERDRRAAPRAVSSAARTSPGRWSTPASSSRSTTPSPRCCTTAARTTSAKADTDVREGIALVRAAGGVPVFAHGLATKRGRIVGDDAIAAMAEAGLLGLEVDHPDHSADERAHLRGLAADLGLIRTGSSDYHGTNKTTPIGACTTDPAQFEALLAAGTGSAPYRD